MKKRVIWGLCLFLFMMLFASLACASSTTQIGNYSYRVLKEGGIEIAGYTGSDTCVVIPATLDGYEVQSIGRYAFDGSLLVSVTIPEGVTNISHNAFSGRRFLEELVLPDSIETIGASAFRGCTSLEKIVLSKNHPRLIFEKGMLYDKVDHTLLFCAPKAVKGKKVKIPDDITQIGAYAFERCSELKSIVIPEGVVSINDNAFYECESLSSITLPSSLRSIGREAFFRCPLESVALPSGLQSIGDKAFYFCLLSSVTIPRDTVIIEDNPFIACSSLAEISVEEGNETFMVLNGALINRDTQELVCYPQGRTEESFIVSRVRSIAPFAFANCDSLKQVQFSSGITHIGSDAFINCSKLQSISFPFTLEKIGYEAFSRCTNLKTVVFYSGDTQLERSSFDYFNLARIYGMPGSTAREFASHFSVPFTPFVEGTRWQSTSSADEFIFQSDGVVHMPTGKGSGIEGRYWVDEQEGEVTFYLNGRYKRDSLTFSGNTLRTGLGYRYECRSFPREEITVETYPLYNSDQPLVGTRWSNRWKQIEIQFVDETTLETLLPDGTLLGSQTYSLNGLEILFSHAENLHAVVRDSALLISEIGETYHDVYNYAGPAITAVIPTPTPEPTPEPTPTPAPTKLALTKEYVIGSWNEGRLVFNADGTADCLGKTGRFRVKAGMVIFTYYHPGHDETEDIYFYWEGDGVLYGDHYEYHKDP